MKKIVTVLVVFAALSASRAVFAQELKFSGYLNSGIGVISSDEEDTGALVKAYAVDAWQNGYRFRLNGAYTNEGKTAGVNFRFQAQNTLASGYFTLPFFYGWVQFFGDVLTVSGGLVDDGVTTPADFWLLEDVGEGLGVLARVKPVAGLDLGLGAYLISQSGGGANNALSNLDLTRTLAIGDVKWVPSVAYTLPDIFRFATSFRWKNQAGETQTPDDYSGRQESSALTGDLRLLAVKDLTAVLAWNLDYLEDFDNKGNIIVEEVLGYKLGDLGIGLNAVQFLYSRTDASNDKIEYDPGLLFNLWGSYTIGGIVPRLDLVYFSGGRSNVAAPTSSTNTTPKYAYDRHGYAAGASRKDADTDYSVIGIRPSVKFNAGSTSVEIGDAINLDSANFDAYKKSAKDAANNTKDRFTNVFYVDLKWSF